MYCKDCRYWYNKGKNYSVCDNLSWANHSEKIGDSSAALFVDANDDSGLEYDLKTGPLFGCINFKERVKK